MANAGAQDVMRGFVGAQPVERARFETLPTSGPRFQELLHNTLDQSAPMLKEFGIDAKEFNFGTDPTKAGAGGTAQAFSEGLALLESEAPGGLGKEGQVASTVANIGLQVCSMFPNPIVIGVVAAVVAIVASVAVLRAQAVYRKQEQLGSDIDRIQEDLAYLCLGVRKGERGVSLDAALQALLMNYRAEECYAILSGTYGAKKAHWRGPVKIASYNDSPRLIEGRMGTVHSAALGLRFLENYGHPSFNARVEAAERGIGYFDRSVYAKGVDWAGKADTTLPTKVLRLQKDAADRTRQLITGIGRASGFSGDALRQLHLGAYWSALAQVIPLQLLSVVQDATGGFNADTRIYTPQIGVPINQDAFWHGFEPTFKQSPEDCVAPCALFFGATEQELVAGEFGKYLTAAGFENYRIFQQAAQQPAAGWGFRQPTAYLQPPASRQSSPVGLLALAAGGALLLTKGGS